MNEVVGVPFPRTASGQASLLPALPRHYSGDLLTVEYRTNPDNIRKLLPPDVELANDDEDPGAVAFIWADSLPAGMRPVPGFIDAIPLQ